jgi:hypothetical protein
VAEVSARWLGVAERDSEGVNDDDEGRGWDGNEEGPWGGEEPGWDCRERSEAIAMNSACLVPFRVAFVAFCPRAMMRLLWTRTQPTGVSSMVSAYSACSRQGSG